MASQFVNWIKSPQGRAYFFSTHFWGPVANWGLPIAALADIRKDESMISGVMSPTMAGYSSIFMAFAWQVQPRNYLLFACHATNAAAQLVQTGRFVNYWYMGGKDKVPLEIAESTASNAKEATKDAAADLSSTTHSALESAKSAASKLAHTTPAEVASSTLAALHAAQGSLDSARQHAAAGGLDALNRGKAIVEEAKRELSQGRELVGESAKEVREKMMELEKEGERLIREGESWVRGKEGQAELKAAELKKEAELKAVEAKKKGWSLW